VLSGSGLNPVRLYKVGQCRIGLRVRVGKYFRAARSRRQVYFRATKVNFHPVLVE
jgi:hypothetical protein